MSKLQTLSCQLPKSHHNHHKRWNTDRSYWIKLWCVHLKGEDFKTDEEPKSDDVGLNRIYQTPSSHLSVVRCVPSQPTEKADWRKYATFYTFTKIENKNCKVVVASGSCINAISSRSLENLGLEVVPTPIHWMWHGLTSRYLRSNNDILSQSISIIIKTGSGVMWSPWMWVKSY